MENSIKGGEFLIKDADYKIYLFQKNGMKNKK